MHVVAFMYYVFIDEAFMHEAGFFLISADPPLPGGGVRLWLVGLEGPATIFWHIKFCSVADFLKMFSSLYPLTQIMVQKKALLSENSVPR